MNAKTILDAGIALAAQKEVNGIPITLVPDGTTLHEHFALMPNPQRIHRVLTLHDTESIVLYVRAFREPGTVIFFDEFRQGGAIFSAVLDYHEGNSTISEAADNETAALNLLAEIHPRWCSHIARYTPRTTDEWRAWMASSNMHMNQELFARFIEEHVDDVDTDEMRRTLTAISLTLQIKKDIAFDSSRRLNNSTVQLNYSENVEGTAANGTIAIPVTFNLKIQPIAGAPPIVVKCRFKYVFRNRAAELWYEIVDPAKVMQATLDTIKQHIQENTGITVLHGAGE